MENKNCLVLSQYRNEGNYNDFIGKFYHFPANNSKSYLSQFDNLPVEFIYYEPLKKGEAEFYGYGKITKKPFEDKREEGYFFVEIEDYKEFSKPVYYKDSTGEILESKSPNFNPQNAVRKIPHQLLDEICLDGGVLLTIESDAHLIKVLGEQLIGSEKVGILELVKNAIDAQASYCRVRIENVPTLEISELYNFEYPNLEGPVIIIEDNGTGMTKEVIQNGWLRPASTIKTNIKEQLKRERDNALLSGSLATYDALYKQLKKEHGRIPLGEKGVGRFATHRLGRYLELRTKTKDIDYELVLKIDWSKFDQISSKFVNLNSIGIGLFREPLLRDYGIRNSGTKLIIYGGKEGFAWDEAIIQDLNASILSLNSPNSKHIFDKNSLNYDTFNAFLECPQIDQLKSEQIFTECLPNFTLDALVNNEGCVDYELKFKHPLDKIPSKEWEESKFDLRFPEDEKKDFGYWFVNDEKRKPLCGSFYIHIDVWYRTKEWIDLPNYKDLISYLDDYGGISMYRDRILVLEAKVASLYDWLGLSKSHIKQGFRVSYRDMIGYIETEQKDNFNIVDKTNREGFIENQSYKDLAKLTRTLIDKVLIPRYTSKRDEFTGMVKGIVTDVKKLNDVAKIGSTFFSNVTDSDYPLAVDPYKFFSNLWENVEERRGGLVNLTESMKQLQKSIKMIEDVQDMFVEQAGFGISVAVSLHEINKITSNFYNGISHLIKSGDFNKIKLEELQATSQSLRSELKRLSPLRAIRNEKDIEFNILKSINYAFEVYKRKIDQENIIFEILNPNENFQLFGRYSTINQVFGNLLDNSIYWIKYDSQGEKCIKILLNKEFRTITIGDTGSDISEIIRPNLFQPGYSLKDPPSGLGLFICKTYLNNMKGRIYETPTKDRIPNMKGAHFTLDFKKTPEYH
jgi:signal transduction histidine kinase